MRRTPIRVKLAAALALPLVASGALTVHEIAQTAGEAASVRREADLARAAMGPSGIITTLQDERTYAALEILGAEDIVEVAVESMEDSRARVDAAITGFRDAVGTRGDAAEAFGPALESLDALADIRSDIDAHPKGVGMEGVEFGHEMFDRYTELVGPFFDAITLVSLEVDDAGLRQGTELVDTAARQIETLSQMLNTVVSHAYLSPGGIDSTAEISEVAMLRSQFLRYAETLRSPGGAYAELGRDRFPEEMTSQVSDRVADAMATGRIDIDVVFDSVDMPGEETYLGFQEALHAMVGDRADGLDRKADRRQVVFGGLALAALVATVVLTWLVSRSITRPLRSLTRQARDVAERRLPEAVLDILEAPLGADVSVAELEPVRVRTRDEVAEVVAVLNRVQESALDLAVEQAVLRRNIADSFVNLGRRNQNLLSRQLDFITGLEAGETDPDTLAALFRLDHLATRMRRNAESLLFLAGIEPPRKFAAPLPIVAVIRSSLSEVEDYERVRAEDIEPATLQGGAAVDIAHLLAELIENALTFSPPDRPVHVHGRRGDDGGYRLAVVDGGPGMSRDQVALANRRLSGQESFTVAPSRYLGHYVTGSLAARYGIVLHLEGAEGRGVTVTVGIPPHLMMADSFAGARPAPAGTW